MPNVNLYVPPDGPRFLIVVPPFGRNRTTQFFREVREKSQYSEEHCSFVTDRTHAAYFPTMEGAEGMALILSSRFPKDCAGRLAVVPLEAPKPTGELDLTINASSSSGDIISLTCEVIRGDSVGVVFSASVKTGDLAGILGLLDAVGIAHTEGWNSFATESLQQIPFRATVRLMDSNRYELSDFKKSDIDWRDRPNTISV